MYCPAGARYRSGGRWRARPAAQSRPAPPAGTDVAAPPAARVVALALAIRPARPTDRRADVEPPGADAPSRRPNIAGSPLISQAHNRL
jgi:hypothetical protein